MRFVLDENLSRPLAVALHALWEPRHEVTTVVNVFGRGTLDEVWLRQLAPTDAAVTLDERMLRAHDQVIRDVKPCLFILSGKAWNKASLQDRAWRLVRYWPDVLKASGAGGIHTVGINGGISRHQ